MSDRSRASLVSWNEYNDQNHGYRGDQGREVMAAYRAAFDAGQVAALTDAAEGLDSAANPDQVWQAADAIRARAVEIAGEDK